MKQYVIGVDFGTLSARALLVDASDGREVAVAVCAYPHAVMTDADFEGVVLERTDALQHPQDYLDALSQVTCAVIRDGGVSPADVVGVGIDFTACTVMPVTADGTPLCFLDEFKNEPHAYVKLWKHHSAQAEADRITALAAAQRAPWLQRYGGKISSEWLFPKLWEVLNKAPQVYHAAARFVEAADWLAWQLTGVETHSSCMAGYKGLWNKRDGYPANDFWRALDVRLDGVVGTKVSEAVVPTGSKVGEVTAAGSAISGLAVGTAIAAPIIDAHAALPAAGIVDGGKLMLIIGTSGCHIVMAKEDVPVAGLCGSVQDGVVPGFAAYEAGQACVGDSFDWFVKRCVPADYAAEAEQNGQSLFDLLTEKAAALSVGESGLLALDWFNGNRTPYVDADLSGVLVGLTTHTRPEEIYRAVLESTAYGTKAIVDLYEAHGVAVDEVYAAGGIAQKNPLLMQIYADVLNKPIRIAASAQAGAKGSAVFAAVAGGCFDTLADAAKVIADGWTEEYVPCAADAQSYATLYREYCTLAEYFAKHNAVMKRLKNK